MRVATGEAPPRIARLEAATLGLSVASRIETLSFAGVRPRRSALQPQVPTWCVGSEGGSPAGWRRACGCRVGFVGTHEDTKDRPFIAATLLVGISGLSLSGQIRVEQCSDGLGMGQAPSRSALWHHGAVSYELRRLGTGLQVVVFTTRASGDRVSVVSEADPVPDDGAVAMALGRPQQENGPCCGLFFGTAPRFTGSVVVRTQGARYSADVADGLWLIVAPLTRLDPASVEWAFLTRTGAVIAQGRGPISTGLDQRGT